MLVPTHNVIAKQQIKQRSSLSPPKLAIHEVESNSEATVYPPIPCLKKMAEEPIRSTVSQRKALRQNMKQLLQSALKEIDYDQELTNDSNSPQ
jgi:hypothetical protein